MGVAYFVSLDKEDIDFEYELDGKRLAKAADKLNQIAKANGMEELESFFGMGGDDLSDILGDEDISREEQWFEAAEGVKYFEALKALLVANDASIKNAKGIIAEIGDFIAVLKKAEAAGAKWHLAIDI